jgi:hypothetical protein
MSVPLDQLYNFLDGVSGHDLLIYRWWPHGSKKWENLLPLRNYEIKGSVYQMTQPILICHDQEPVDLIGQKDCFTEYLIDRWQKIRNRVASQKIVNFFKSIPHLRELTVPTNAYDYVLLLHSELNSKQITQCQEQYQYIPVYYWSHALIARDWFRYAFSDPALTAPKKYSHDFLIYNRAWSGTREYRLKFAELLIESRLTQHCKMGFSTSDEQTDYRQFAFKNQNFSIINQQMHEYFFDNQTPSNASADYNSVDYQTCAIEVVLETLFDDTRHHLTEKILRPIACGQPFILAATPGSLGYLRSYGFKTFDGIIDESYDLIKDPIIRLNAIVKIMKDIAQMPTDKKNQMIQDLREISKYNQERFFSDNFQNFVVQEFKNNIKLGLEKMSQFKTGKHLTTRLKCAADNGTPLVPQFCSRQEIAEVWKWVRNHC